MTLSFSDSLANLAPALALVQAEVEHATKGKVNPAFKSKYVDITEVIDTIRPVLEKHGFSVSQHPGFHEGANSGIVTLETLLLHESGEWIRSEASAPLERETAQGVGSAITYLRRYALTSIIGLGQEDDDGQAASQARTQERRQPERPAPPVIPSPGNPPTRDEVRERLGIALKMEGVEPSAVLKVSSDPITWLYEHEFDYAGLVARARQLLQEAQA